MSDKLHSIQERMRRVLSHEGIIDEQGTILDLPAYQKLIQEEIEAEEWDQKLFQTSNGRVTNGNIWSTIQAEIRYLQGILNHTKNIDPLIENPIESRPGANPVKPTNRPGLFKRLSDAYHTMGYVVAARLMR